MNKRVFFLPVFIGVAMVCFACTGRGIRGEGQVVTNKLSVADFTALDLSVPAKATITVQPGAATSVEITGYANLLEHIKVKNQGNKLVVYMDKDISWNFRSGDETRLKITVSSLSALTTDGAASAEVHGIISGKAFALDISGAGKVAVDSLMADNFTTDVSGAGDITVKGGTVHTASYHISGAGKIRAYGLQAEDVSTEISGAAKAELTATARLTVSISGAGSIRYKGHPAITKDISGAGSLNDEN